MAKTPSTMLALGTPFPHFALADAVGKTFKTQEILSQNPKAVLIAFICNHCPYVKHIAPALAAVTTLMLQQSDVYVFAINSNDIEKYPEDGPEKMLLESKSRGYKFPYLIDPTQKVAHSFQAACTPEFYLFDGSLKLAYRGQFDGSRPQNSIVPTGDDLWHAFQSLMQGQKPSSLQQPSIGCNIKWKPGNEPRYENFF